ncbi:TPA: flagellin [Candidatus Sumerlaeota bacterium]|jgi:flagellin|nr:flagellin [Candidatus Sumerlaeota bacterium]
MSMVINTNIASINGQRNVNTSSKALNKSLERLSSGLKINSASDDAAGLAISTGLQSQIKGVDQAASNCSDGISLISTADGSMDTYTSILQRLRELAVEASSDVMSADDRSDLDLEVQQQIKELNRIATTMDFNGAPLFDGSFVGKSIQAGYDAGQTVDISISDLRTKTIGGVAQCIGTYSDPTTALTDGGITINGVEIPASTSKDTGDKINAINSVYSETGVNAREESAQVVGITAVLNGSMDVSTNYIKINGYTIPASDTIAVADDDSTGTLRAAINEISDKTGVEATLNASNELVLTSTNSSEEFTVSYGGTGNTTSGILNDGVTAVDTDVSIGGRVRLYSDSPYTVAGTEVGLIGATVGTYGIDDNSSIDNVDVLTYDHAQETIVMVDNALRQVTKSRAELGAISNRLDNTVSNLEIASENLTAANSQIVDADFASETANMTRAQILQQSGVAVLAQANASKQYVLQLLQ